MDFCPSAEPWMVGRSCGVCDDDIAAGQQVGFDICCDEPGHQTVTHWWCHAAVQHAKVEAFREAANEAAKLGAHESVIFRLRAKAQRIEQAVTGPMVRALRTAG